MASILSCHEPSRNIKGQKRNLDKTERRICHHPPLREGRRPGPVLAAPQAVGQDLPWRKRNKITESATRLRSTPFGLSIRIPPGGSGQRCDYFGDRRGVCLASSSCCARCRFAAFSLPSSCAFYYFESLRLSSRQKATASLYLMHDSSHLYHSLTALQ